MQYAIGKNADLLDAWLMGLVAMGADFDKKVEKKKPVEKVIWENRLKPDGTFERVKRKLAEPELGPTAM